MDFVLKLEDVRVKSDAKLDGASAACSRASGDINSSGNVGRNVPCHAQTLRRAFNQTLRRCVKVARYLHVC